MKPEGRVRAVVFDMDGLMLDTEPVYKVAWQTASAELGYDLDDALYAGFVGRPNVECERDLLERFGSGFPLDRFRAAVSTQSTSRAPSRRRPKRTTRPSRFDQRASTIVSA